MKDKLSQRCKVDRRYYIATEKDFITVLDNALMDEQFRQVWRSENKIAALLLGNSYILKFVARLPESQFDTIYVCDSDIRVLHYIENLLDCLRASSDYDAFKENLARLNTTIIRDEPSVGTHHTKHILDYAAYQYDYASWVSERFLEESLFAACKKKLTENKFAIEFRHGYIQTIQCKKSIGLIHFSNIHQFIGQPQQTKLEKHIELCSRFKIIDKIAILSSDILHTHERKPQAETRLKLEYRIVDKRNILFYRYFVHSMREGRQYHFFEVRGKWFRNLQTEAYKQLKGDYLKSRILADMQDKLSGMHNQAELNAFEQNITSTDEYKVLRYSQGIISSIFCLKTSSMDALKKMIERRRAQLASEFAPSSP